jgi:hypothetical protein
MTAGVGSLIGLIKLLDCRLQWIVMLSVIKNGKNGRTYYRKAVDQAGLFYRRGKPVKNKFITDRISCLPNGYPPSQDRSQP